MARTTKGARPSAETPAMLHDSRMCRVTPALGQPWLGKIIDPGNSQMGVALLHAQDAARRTGAEEDTYVIVRCLDSPDEGMKTGSDYLVLRRFVQDC